MNKITIDNLTVLQQPPKPGQRVLMVAPGVWLPVGISGATSSNSSLLALEAGYINAEGNFQPLSFDGTQASDSGSAVAGLQHKIFNTGQEEPDYGGSGGSGGAAMEFYKCSYVNSNSWGGYKAIFNGSYYEFQSNSTAGLAYSGFTPVVGNCYNEEATLQATLYDEGRATGLVFHVALSSAASKAQTGQPLGSFNQYITYQVYKGIPCAYFDTNPYAGIYCNNVSDFPSGTAARTISLWVNLANSSGNQASLFSYGKAQKNQRYTVGVSNTAVGIWGYENSATYPYTFTIGQWVHIVVTYAAGNQQVYVNGQSIGSQVHSNLNTDPVQAVIGNDAGQNGPSYAKTYVYLASVRLYNRVLTQSQITTLASQFTPTA